MIIIQPSGGLCNRIRSINSAATLARKKGVPLKVLWLNAPELNCPFEELFLPTDEFELINIRSLNNPKKLFLQLTAKQRFNNEDILKNKTGDTLNAMRSFRIRCTFLHGNSSIPPRTTTCSGPRPRFRRRSTPSLRIFLPT